MREMDKFAERAIAARREAEEATLENVRNRSLRAAEAWESMAERTRVLDDRRAAHERDKAAAAEAAAAAETTAKWPDNLEIRKPKQNDRTSELSNS